MITNLNSVTDIDVTGDALVSGWLKGVPADVEPFPLSQLAARQWNLLREDLQLPVAILKDRVLDANSRSMLSYVKAAGADLCPHGKTTMSPQLFHRQLRDGAWGLTAATINHLKVYRSIGINRVIFANQLIGQPAIRYVLDELAGDPFFEFFCVVDSAENIRTLNAAASRTAAPRPLQLLIEVGSAGGRAGTRGVKAALELARQIADCSPHIELRGVEAFEGIFPGHRDAKDIEKVRRMLDDVVAVAEACDEYDYFAQGDIILTAGGSAYFDLVCAQLKRAKIRRPHRVVLRSGCYLTHDNGFYNNAYNAMLERDDPLHQSAATLSPALEVWAYVQSVPEPHLAIIGLGKRDVSHDIHLPVLTQQFRPGRDQRPLALSGVSLCGLNDQHAFVHVEVPKTLAVGDMVSVGISHPCTTFDKWKVIFVVDDDYNIDKAITTHF